VKRERLLSPASAATLGRYMRDGVLEGTGRILRNHPLRIAGKTGRPEVPARRRIRGSSGSRRTTRRRRRGGSRLR
jgi:cell division protein FtsI/penicillin-binding protein 2